MSPLKPETIAIRTRLLAVLAGADEEQLTTAEISARAGFNNFEHHAYVTPQLRALAKVGVIIRSPLVPGAAASWRINAANQSAAALTARIQRMDALARNGHLPVATSAATHQALTAVSPPTTTSSPLSTMRPKHWPQRTSTYASAALDGASPTPGTRPTWRPHEYYATQPNSSPTRRRSPPRRLTSLTTTTNHYPPEGGWLTSPPEAGRPPYRRASFESSKCTPCRTRGSRATKKPVARNLSHERSAPLACGRIEQG